jgi:D-3-phosphoglycerate dehydrogenase
MDKGVIDDKRIWTCEKGSYADGVAEHGLALMLAAARRLPECIRARSFQQISGRRLSTCTICTVGTGGIGSSLARIVKPLEPRMIGVNSNGRAVEGFDACVPTSRLLEALEEADFAVLATALTPATRKMIGSKELSALGSQGWLVNLARGELVDTEALVSALRAGKLGGAALDVTDPEPLPDGHPLWDMENVIITPHTANPHVGAPWDSHQEEVAGRLEANVRAFASKGPMSGLVNPEKGY